MKLREVDVTKQIRSFLELRGWRIKRNQRTVVAGAFQSGEPGEPDIQAIYYLEPHTGVTLTLWVEFKSPTDKRTCRCHTRKRGKCTVCAQRLWREKEQARGAIVWQMDDLATFTAAYERQFSWLPGPGQLALSLQEAS